MHEIIHYYKNDFEEKQGDWKTNICGEYLPCWLPTYYVFHGNTYIDPDDKHEGDIIEGYLPL